MASKIEVTTVNVIQSRSSFQRRVAESIYTALGDRAPADRDQALADIEGWLNTPNECPPGAGLAALTKINGINTIGMLADMYAAEKRCGL